MINKIEWPVRFRTKEDAELFEECWKNGKHFPEEKRVIPFEVVNGQSVLRQEYRNAPFEFKYIYEYDEHA